MNLWAICKGIDRFEANTETPDFVELFRALVNATNASHIPLGEGITVVGHPKSLLLKVERNRTQVSRSRPPAESVFSVLQKLENEMCSFVIAIGKQLWSVTTYIGSVSPDVVGSGFLVVTSHSLLHFEPDAAVNSRGPFYRA